MVLNPSGLDSKIKLLGNTGGHISKRRSMSLSETKMQCFREVFSFSKGPRMESRVLFPSNLARKDSIR